MGRWRLRRMGIRWTCTHSSASDGRFGDGTNQTTKKRKREGSRRRNLMLRVSSPLSKEVEELVHTTIGCCLTVHRALGPGLFETIYSRAVALELREDGISFEREKPYPVLYRGDHLCGQRLDCVRDGAIVSELEA